MLLSKLKNLIILSWTCIQFSLQPILNSFKYRIFSVMPLLWFWNHQKLFRIRFVISNFTSALSHYSSISTSEPRISNFNKIVDISRWTSEIETHSLEVALMQCHFRLQNISQPKPVLVSCYPFEIRIRQNILHNRILIICGILCLLSFLLQRNQHKQQISWIQATQFFSAYQWNVFIYFIAIAWYRFNI